MIPNKIKSKVRQRYNNKCAHCGSDGNVIHLEFSFNISLVQGGKIEEENIELLCPNCHALKDRIHFTEFDLNNYLTNLLSKSNKFIEVSQDSRFNDTQRFRADITAKQRIENNVYKSILIEVKKLSSYTMSSIESVIKQLKEYEKYIDNTDLVFAFPGKLLESEYQLFEKENIQVWDKDKIGEIFLNEIQVTPHPIFQYLFTSNTVISEKQRLINELKGVASGKQYWFDYQKLIGKILNSLFSIELSSPITELPDNFKINRRDFILPNYAESGFWAYLRAKYHADFIVVDAKNYSQKVKKNQVLQVANYLKKHGTGLLGIIICRNGGDRSCSLTIRELWATENKLILILNDSDIIKMLGSNEPEEIIKQRIEEFRLSI